LIASVVGLVQCASGFPFGSPPPGAPAAPNESVLTAQVLDAVIVDSLTLNISPQQSLCVLTLKLLSVRSVGDLQNFLHGKSRETIRAYTKNLSLLGLKGKTVIATVSFHGDEWGGRFWVSEALSTNSGVAQ